MKLQDYENARTYPAWVEGCRQWANDIGGILPVPVRELERARELLAELETFQWLEEALAPALQALWERIEVADSDWQYIDDLVIDVLSLQRDGQDDELFADAVASAQRIVREEII